jgi:hypothetical protein
VEAGAAASEGYAAEEIIGHHFSALPEEDVRGGKPELELAWPRPRGAWGRGLALRKDGTAFWANVVITALATRPERSSASAR